MYSHILIFTIVELPIVLILFYLLLFCKRNEVLHFKCTCQALIGDQMQ